MRINDFDKYKIANDPKNPFCDLYQLEKETPITNFGTLNEVCYLDDGTYLGSQLSSYQIGEVFNRSEFGLYYNYVLEGVYLDQNFETPYVDQIINSDKFTLYGRFYKETPTGLDLHKVTIYYAPTSTIELNDSNISKDNIYREFYIKDGTYIPRYSFIDKGQTNSMSLLDIYYYDSLNPYKYEPITSDTEFVIINMGVNLKINNNFKTIKVHIGDELYELKYTENSKLDLSSFDFESKYELYLDSDFKESYNGGFSVTDLYLK